MNNSTQAFAAFFNNSKHDNHGDSKLSFPVFVKYNFLDQEVISESRVILYLDTSNYGKVSLDENGVLSSDRFHLDFTQHYQRYEHDNDENQNKLIIDGDSPKMGGRYTVTLTEK